MAGGVATSVRAMAAVGKIHAATSAPSKADPTSASNPANPDNAALVQLSICSLMPVRPGFVCVATPRSCVVAGKRLVSAEA
jgi:hypothetical protein